MKKVFTSVFLGCLLFFVINIRAQAPIPITMPFGKVDIADLQLKTCEFEKDANAMVLFDKGDVYFQDTHIVMERHKRIKIFNEKGKDEANVRLEYYSGGNFEFITNIQVETINDNGGKPEITKLEKKLIYTEVIDKARSAIVFAFPNVKPGSIIEFKYQWETPAFYNMPDWYFQSDLPTRYSELTSEAPDFLYFKTQTRINNAYAKNKKDGNKEIRALVNVPSLKDEPYMRSRIDNLQCVLFQLTTIKPSGGFVQTFNDSWEKIGKNLDADEDFGDQLKKKLKGEDLIITQAKSLKTDNDKIAYIFKQVKDHMKWNEVDRWYTSDGTATAWDKQTGNSSEINLALCHLLKKAGLKVYPMIVSTRKHGRISGAYPSLSLFNRSVAYIPVDSTTNYVLDATGKYNVYNQIPDELLNSFGFYTSKDEKINQLLFLQNTNPARQVVLINASILPDGKMDGTAQVSSFSYHRLNSIEKYKNDGEEKYKKYLRDDDNNLEISSLKIENMDIDSLPLTQTIGFKLALAGSDQNYIYVNPNLFTSLRTNPFLSENRSSDIDFGHRDSYVINGTYKIPAGFKTDAIPKNISMVTPDKGISFRRIIVEEDGMIKVNYTINYRKTIYFKEDYPEFREFYKRMSDMLNEQIVLKKG